MICFLSGVIPICMRGGGQEEEEVWDGGLGRGWLARLENQNEGLANHSPELKR